MARDIGPVCRMCRRENTKLFLKGARCDSDKCAFTRRPNPPGMHTHRRGKLTDYGVHLRANDLPQGFRIKLTGVQRGDIQPVRRNTFTQQGPRRSGAGRPRSCFDSCLRTEFGGQRRF